MSETAHRTTNKLEKLIRVPELFEMGVDYGPIRDILLDVVSKVDSLMSNSPSVTNKSEVIESRIDDGGFKRLNLRIDEVVKMCKQQNEDFNAEIRDIKAFFQFQIKDIRDKYDRNLTRLSSPNDVYPSPHEVDNGGGIVEYISDDARYDFLAKQIDSLNSRFDNMISLVNSSFGQRQAQVVHPNEPVLPETIKPIVFDSPKQELPQAEEQNNISMDIKNAKIDEIGDPLKKIETEDLIRTDAPELKPIITELPVPEPGVKADPRIDEIIKQLSQIKLDVKNNNEKINRTIPTVNNIIKEFERQTRDLIQCKQDIKGKEAEIQHLHERIVDLDNDTDRKLINFMKKQDEKDELRSLRSESSAPAPKAADISGAFEQIKTTFLNNLENIDSNYRAQVHYLKQEIANLKAAVKKLGGTIKDIQQPELVKIVPDNEPTRPSSVRSTDTSKKSSPKAKSTSGKGTETDASEAKSRGLVDFTAAEIKVRGIIDYCSVGIQTEERRIPLRRFHAMTPNGSLPNTIETIEIGYFDLPAPNEPERFPTTPPIMIKKEEVDQNLVKEIVREDISCNSSRVNSSRGVPFSQYPLIPQDVSNMPFSNNDLMLENYNIPNNIRALNDLSPIPKPKSLEFSFEHLLNLNIFSDDASKALTTVLAEVQKQANQAPDTTQTITPSNSLVSEIKSPSTNNEIKEQSEAPSSPQEVQNPPIDVAGILQQITQLNQNQSNDKIKSKVELHDKQIEELQNHILNLENAQNQFLENQQQIVNSINSNKQNIPVFIPDTTPTTIAQNPKTNKSSTFTSPTKGSSKIQHAYSGNISMKPKHSKRTARQSQQNESPQQQQQQQPSPQQQQQSKQQSQQQSKQQQQQQQSKQQQQQQQQSKQQQQQPRQQQQMSHQTTNSVTINPQPIFQNSPTAVVQSHLSQNSNVNQASQNQTQAQQAQPSNVSQIPVSTQISDSQTKTSSRTSTPKGGRQNEPRIVISFVSDGHQSSIQTDVDQNILPSNQQEATNPSNSSPVQIQTNDANSIAPLNSAPMSNDVYGNNQNINNNQAPGFLSSSTESFVTEDMINEFNELKQRVSELEHFAESISKHHMPHSSSLSSRHRSHSSSNTNKTTNHPVSTGQAPMIAITTHNEPKTNETPKMQVTTEDGQPPPSTQQQELTKVESGLSDLQLRFGNLIKYNHSEDETLLSEEESEKEDDPLKPKVELTMRLENLVNDAPDETQKSEMLDPHDELAYQLKQFKLQCEEQFRIMREHINNNRVDIQMMKSKDNQPLIMPSIPDISSHDPDDNDDDGAVRALRRKLDTSTKELDDRITEVRKELYLFMQKLAEGLLDDQKDHKDENKDGDKDKDDQKDEKDDISDAARRRRELRKVFQNTKKQNKKPLEPTYLINLDGEEFEKRRKEFLDSIESPRIIKTTNYSELSVPEPSREHPKELIIDNPPEMRTTRPHGVPLSITKKSAENQKVSNSNPAIEPVDFKKPAPFQNPPPATSPADETRFIGRSIPQIIREVNVTNAERSREIIDTILPILVEMRTELQMKIEAALQHALAAEKNMDNKVDKEFVNDFFRKMRTVVNDLKTQLDEVKNSMPERVTHDEMQSMATDLYKVLTKDQNATAGTVNYRCLFCGAEKKGVSAITDKNVIDALGDPQQARQANQPTLPIIVEKNALKGRRSVMSKLESRRIPPLRANS